jgi:hypothetical protein
VCDSIYIDDTGETGGPFTHWVDATTPNATYSWTYY